MAYDRHHVIPRSVCKDLGINPNFFGNIRKVKTNKHRAWHLLFGSATPEQAIEIIRQEWSLSEAGHTEMQRLMEHATPPKRSKKCST